MASAVDAEASCSGSIMNDQPLFLDRFSTPLGVMLLVTDGQARLCALDWEDYEARMHRLLRFRLPPRRRGDGFALSERRAPGPRAALEAYFSGQLDALDLLAVEMGGTPFQREVWAALRAIPAGETMTYGALATRIGRPSAVRAVGLANGANPVGVVVPCHRVIGADATLTGYAGGLERKRWLLRHEGVMLGPSSTQRLLEWP
jgi:methylated-DNA-[protein]-cysteine S-methyltransferase